MGFIKRNRSTLVGIGVALLIIICVAVGVAGLANADRKAESNAESTEATEVKSEIESGETSEASEEETQSESSKDAEAGKEDSKDVISKETDIAEEETQSERSREAEGGSETVHICSPTRVETAATCLEGGLIQEICSNCQKVMSSQETVPLGHDFKMSIWESPTCLKGGYYNNTCQRCGLEECVTEAPLPHETEDIIVQEGNCMEDTIIRHVCKNCGQQTESDTRFTPSVHEWVSDHVDGVEMTYCIRCGVAQ